jgi:uncharacterized membrane protein YbhN (UPF0104 family)
MSSDPDEDRWSRALSMARGEPTDAAEQVRRRLLRLRIALVIGVGLLSLGIGLALAFLLPDLLTAEPVEPPTWVRIIGLVIALVGLVVQIAALVAIVRANRRHRQWRSPLLMLSRRQRKELLAQVRGQAPTDTARLPLSRELAGLLIRQRSVLAVNLGFGLLWVGLLIALPTWWRAAIAGGFVLLLAIAWPRALRDERRAREFLARHPDEPSSVA